CVLPDAYVKHPYESAPAETIGALHWTVRPELPRKVPGWASRNDTLSASYRSVNWNAPTFVAPVTSTSTENGDAGAASCDAVLTLTAALTGVAVGVNGTSVGVFVSVGHVQAYGWSVYV